MFERLNLRNFSYICFFSLLALFLCHSWFGPDIWYHLTWGRSLVNSMSLLPRTQTLIDQPLFANIYWAFQIAIYVSYLLGGLYFLSALYALIWVCIAALWFRQAKVYASPAGAWLFLGFILLCQVRFEQRPEVLSYLLILAFISILCRVQIKPRRWPWKPALLLFFLESLWCGLHSYFFLGLALTVAYSFSLLTTGSQEPSGPQGPQISQRPQISQISKWKDNWRSALLFPLATALATCINPFGFRVWETVWAYAKVGRNLSDLNQELFPTWSLTLTPLTLIFWLWFGLTLVLALYRLRDPKFRFASLTSFIGLLLCVLAVRNLPLLPIFSGLLWSTVPKFKPQRKFWLSDVGVCMVAILIATMWINGSYSQMTGSMSHFGVKPEWSAYPIGATKYLQKENFKGRLFCDSYDGGYLEYFLPDIQVAGDSYFSDAERTRAYFSAIREPQALAALNSQWDFNALLINVENLSVLDWLLDQSQWTLTYNDSHRAIFERSPKVATDLATATYWHGGALRNSSEAFGPTAWSILARKRNWPQVIAKILNDVSSSPEIPSALLFQALKFSIDNHHPEITQKISELIQTKSLIGNPQDIESLHRLVEASAK